MSSASEAPREVLRAVHDKFGIEGLVHDEYGEGGTGEPAGLSKVSIGDDVILVSVHVVLVQEVDHTSIDEGVVADPGAVFGIAHGQPFFERTHVSRKMSNVGVPDWLGYDVGFVVRWVARATWHDAWCRDRRVRLRWQRLAFEFETRGWSKLLLLPSRANQRAEAAEVEPE